MKLKLFKPIKKPGFSKTFSLECDDWVNLDIRSLGRFLEIEMTSEDFSSNSVLLDVSEAAEMTEIMLAWMRTGELHPNVELDSISVVEAGKNKIFLQTWGRQYFNNSDCSASMVIVFTRAKLKRFADKIYKILGAKNE